MREEIALENGRLSDFHGLVTLTLNRVILHTIMHQHHSSTSTYISYFLNKLFVDGRSDGHLRPTVLGRLRGVDLKISLLHQNSTDRPIPAPKQRLYRVGQKVIPLVHYITLYERYHFFGT